jgi:HTH-type transcriptional regulator / antitoxin HigA
VRKTGTTIAADDYMELIRKFPLRSIRNGRDHQAAIRVLTPLAGRATPPLTSGESQYLDALIDLVKAYESQSPPMKLRRMSPLRIVRYLMEESGMNTEELGKVLGTQTPASLFLSGKRPLSKAHIFRLAERFALEPGLFLGQE